MSDYRGSNYDYRNPDDPFRNETRLDPAARAPASTWGWVAAAVFLVIVLAVAFGVGHQPGQGGTNVASNSAMQPTVTHSAPSTMAPPATAPSPSVNNPAPITPTPSAPAAPVQPSGAR